MHRRPRTFSSRLAHGLVGAATVVAAALAVILGVDSWSAAGEQQTVEPQASTRVEMVIDRSRLRLFATARRGVRKAQHNKEGHAGLFKD